MKYNQPITQHHIVCQAWGWRTVPNNIVWLRQNIHQAVHTVFQDDTPIQRLRRILESDKISLSPATYLAISNTLKRYEWVIELSAYEDGVVNVDQFYRRLNRE